MRDILRPRPISYGMKIFVRAKPKTKHERVEKVDETHFVICVKEAATEGRANQAIIGALAGHFGVPKSRIKIISGKTSKRKILEIL